jgi:hypothetical protein
MIDAASHRKSARAYQLKHFKLGLCQKCSEPVVLGSIYCAKHLEYSRRHDAAKCKGAKPR